MKYQWNKLFLQGTAEAWSTWKTTIISNDSTIYLLSIQVHPTTNNNVAWKKHKDKSLLVTSHYKYGGTVILR